MKRGDTPRGGHVFTVMYRRCLHPAGLRLLDGGGAKPGGARSQLDQQRHRGSMQPPHPRAFLSLNVATVAGHHCLGNQMEERFLPTIKDVLYTFLKTNIFLWKKKEKNSATI